MADTVVVAAAVSSPSPPASPLKETDAKKATANGGNAKKYDGEGLPFKGKLIGMEDLNVDRDEKICLDSMFKLKAVVRARGEHKQKVQLNLTMSAVKVIDDASKTQIAIHEIERISFVVIDPRDTRAFGYIYNTSDDRHQFWAIKTERAAAATVLALKELFELAFEQYTNAEKAKAEVPKPTPSSPVVPVPPPPEAPVPIAASVVVTAAPVPPPVQAVPIPSLLDDNLWGDNSSTTVIQPPASTQPAEIDIWSVSQPAPPVTRPVPKAEDSLDDLFNAMTTESPRQAPSNALFDVFNTAPPPVPVAPYANMFPPTVTPSYPNMFPPAAQPSFFNPTPIVPQPSQSFMPTVLTPLQPVQQDLLSPTSLSPVAPPTVTSPFAGLDLLGLSSAPPAKTSKESFFPAMPGIKTIQQMQMERNP